MVIMHEYTYGPQYHAYHAYNFYINKNANLM